MYREGPNDNSKVQLSRLTLPRQIPTPPRPHLYLPHRKGHGGHCAEGELVQRRGQEEHPRQQLHEALVHWILQEAKLQVLNSRSASADPVSSHAPRESRGKGTEHSGQLLPLACIEVASN